MKKFALFITMIVMFVICSCNSVPEIPPSATSTQLIQLGQDSLSLKNYVAAETYYNAVIQRYGMDTKVYIEARYELGHMYLQQKKYQEAYRNFFEILEIFENAEYGSIPASFKKLAQMGIENIPEKNRTLE
ncbi:MAG: hypothetical protein HDR52_07050 [Treponema sp.]|nr:hypothetical protein [Treponema sp.]